MTASGDTGATAAGEPEGITERLGLGSRAKLAWASYDWANSAFATTVIAAVFPLYYEGVIGASLAGNRASVLFGYTTAASLLVAAVLSPVLGALADGRRAKKRFLAGFAALGVVTTAGLYLTGEGDVVLASALFGAANVGFVGANVFYDSLLPHVADGDDDRLSTAGFALGYLGGGLLLVLNLAWILSPSTFGLASETVATRLALLSVAVWWAVFSVPVLRYVEEPDPESRGTGERTTTRADGGESTETNPLWVALQRLRRTAGELGQYRDLTLFLVAFLLYADGIGTVIRMASIYGAEIGLGQTSIVGALVLVQFLGVPFAFAFGGLADRISPKRAIYLGLAVYVAISVGGFFMTEAWQFWALAVGVAAVQGGTQAVSRSVYGSLVPRDRTSEFFGFYSVSSKFAGVAGPALFGLVGDLTGSARFSIVSLLVFFLGGAAVLSRVDIEEGRRVARAATAGDGSEVSA